MNYYLTLAKWTLYENDSLVKLQLIKYFSFLSWRGLALFYFWLRKTSKSFGNVFPFHEQRDLQPYGRRCSSTRFRRRPRGCSAASKRRPRHGTRIPWTARRTAGLVSVRRPGTATGTFALRPRPRRPAAATRWFSSETTTNEKRKSKRFWNNRRSRQKGTSTLVVDAGTGCGRSWKPTVGFYRPFQHHSTRSSSVCAFGIRSSVSNTCGQWLRVLGVPGREREGGGVSEVVRKGSRFRLELIEFDFL